jgi:hypothetical protein
MNLLQTSFFPFHYGVLAFQQGAAPCVGNAVIKTTLALLAILRDGFFVCAEMIATDKIIHYAVGSL